MGEGMVGKKKGALSGQGALLARSSRSGLLHPSALESVACHHFTSDRSSHPRFPQSTALETFLLSSPQRLLAYGQVG